MKLITRRPAVWTLQAPVVARASREIAASPAAVFDVLADHEAWPQWFRGVKRVEVTGGEGVGVGARRRVTLHGGTRFDEEFVTWQPGEAFGFTVVAMRPRLLRSLNELVTLEDLGGDRCRVTYHQGFDPRPWSRWLVRLLARWILPKALQSALASLSRAVHV